jgi:hypothetical protein
MMALGLDIAERESEAIQQLCRQIADGLDAAGGCPRCAATLQAKVAFEAVEVSCPSGCFRFSYRRDPLTGAFVSGLLSFADQDTAIPPGPAQRRSVEGPGPGI